MLRSKRSSVSMVSFTLLFIFVSGAAFAQLGQPALKPLALKPGNAVALADGVLVDAERGMAYLKAPRGGIEAIALEDGARLWSTETEAKPLFVLGDLLIAQAPAKSAGWLELLSFDAQDGVLGEQKARLALPEGVWAHLSDGPKSSFRARAGLLGAELVVSWREMKSGNSDELQGYLPSEEEGMAPKAGERVGRSREGAAHIDLASGEVTAFDKAFTLARPLDMIEGTPLKSRAGLRFASADGRHILESTRNPGGGVWRSYRWTISERAGGAPLGELLSFSSAAPFVVTDGRLFYVSQRHYKNRGEDIAEEPVKLRALDLMSGLELWSAKADEPDFRGDYAP